MENIKEIQLDCDWTNKTRGKYFALLSEVKTYLNPKDILLSSTIRLHQVKYFKETGVPPIDKGMLMFYNIGDINDPKTTNSILDLDDAKKYLTNFWEYPLKLDIAFPIFSWGVLIRRGRTIKLISNLRPEDLKDDNKYIKVEENKYKVINSHYLEGYYLYEKDLIRTENVSCEQLTDAAKIMSSVLDNKDIVVSFFHLDRKCLKYYDYEELKTVCDIFY